MPWFLQKWQEFSKIEVEIFLQELCQKRAFSICLLE